MNELEIEQAVNGASVESRAAGIRAAIEHLDEQLGKINVVLSRVRELDEAIERERADKAIATRELEGLHRIGDAIARSTVIRCAREPSE